MFKQPEPTDPVKQQISKHIRAADELTRVQQYESAMLEIDKALKLDPKNNLARQFQERVRLMWKRYQPEVKIKEGPKERTLEERMQHISELLATAEDLVAKKQYKLALETVAEVYKTDPSNYYAQAFSGRIDQLMKTEAEHGTQVFKRAIQRSRPGAEPSTEKGSLGMYRELLREILFDGKVTQDEAQQLVEVRALFGLSDEEHQQVEQEVKIEAYVDALKMVWRDGIASEQEKNILRQMQVKYGLSPEDVTRAEQKVAEARKAPKSKETILIVDSDREAIVTTGNFFRAHGYNVVLAQKLDEAYHAIIKQLPDVILSELKFTEGAADGFEFLESVKQYPLLKPRPFIFTSKTEDPKVLRASLRLGAAHVFTKPLDFETVLAAVEGKLKML